MTQTNLEIAGSARFFSSLLRARRGKERSRMPEISYVEKADPDSIYADEDRASLIEATQSEQAGRYAEVLWLEQKLIGPLRPHKEDRLRKALVNTEAVYEAQWIELEMAVGSRRAFELRMEIEGNFVLNFIFPAADN